MPSVPHPACSGLLQLCCCCPRRESENTCGCLEEDELLQSDKPMTFCINLQFHVFKSLSIYMWNPVLFPGYDFSSVIRGTLLSALTSAPFTVCMRSCDTKLRFCGSEETSSCWRQSKLLGQSLCLNASTKASYTVRENVGKYQGLWLKIITTYGPVLALIPRPVMKETQDLCLAMLITFGKNWRLKKFGSAEVHSIPQPYTAWHPTMPAAIAENHFISGSALWILSGWSEKGHFVGGMMLCH